ncbi:MAG: hypothetical protein JRN06_08535 [Nitrososphaerota archaeon]|nr:hypothetical protein [Nitrososphaerota archaeon]MDG7024169.1 hypothetical protein [Nitrososphaerota archaeon]
MKDRYAILLAMVIGTGFVSALTVPSALYGLQLGQSQGAANLPQWSIMQGMMTTQGQTVQVGQAVQTIKNAPQDARLIPYNNTIVFDSKNVTLVVFTMGGDRAINLTGRQPPSYAKDDVFVISGLVDPILVIPIGASLHATIINLDEDMYHNFVVTALPPPYPYMAMQGMMTNWQQGTRFAMAPFLPPANYGQGTAHEYSYSLSLDTPGTLWYMCTYPGHAQLGMYGEIIVKG